MLQKNRLKNFAAWFSSLFTSVFYPFQFKPNACTIKPEKVKKPRTRVTKPKETVEDPQAVTTKKSIKTAKTTQTKGTP